MKRIILFITTSFLISFSSYAQLDKKTWLVGGSGNFYSYNQEYFYQNTGFPPNTGTAKYTDIDVSVAVGYFVINKLALGLTPTFSSSKGSTSGGATPNGNQLAIGPFARYYFLGRDKPFNILSEVSYQIGVNNSAAPPKSKGEFNRFSIMGGSEIFFNSIVGMELLIGYKSTTISIDNSPYTFSNINKGLQMSVGFQIHLEKI